MFTVYALLMSYWLSVVAKWNKSNQIVFYFQVFSISKNQNQIIRNPFWNMGHSEVAMEIGFIFLFLSIFLLFFPWFFFLRKSVPWFSWIWNIFFGKNWFHVKSRETSLIIILYFAIVVLTYIIVHIFSYSYYFDSSFRFAKDNVSSRERFVS